MNGINSNISSLSIFLPVLYAKGKSPRLALNISVLFQHGYSCFPVYLLIYIRVIKCLTHNHLAF